MRGPHSPAKDFVLCTPALFVVCGSERGRWEFVRTPRQRAAPFCTLYVRVDGVSSPLGRRKRPHPSSTPNPPLRGRWPIWYPMFIQFIPVVCRQQIRLLV